MQMPNEKPKPVIRKARIKPGSKLFVDFSVQIWPYGKGVDVDTIFDVEKSHGFGGTGYELRADGYGRRSWLGEIGKYGNGAIFVGGTKDLIFLDESSQEELF